MCPMLTGFIGKTVQRAMEIPQVNNLVRTTSKTADGFINSVAEPGAEAVLNIGAKWASKVLPDKYTPLSADVVEVCNSLMQTAQNNVNNQSFFSPIEEKILNACKLASVFKPDLSREVVADLAKRNLANIKSNGSEQFYNSVITLIQAQPKKQLFGFISTIIKSGADAVSNVLLVKLPKTEMVNECASVLKKINSPENELFGFTDLEHKIVEICEAASIGRPDITHEIISSMITSKMSQATQELENPLTQNGAIKKLEFYKPISDRLTLIKDKIITPPSSDSNVKDIESKLFALGVDTNCADEFTFANHLHTAVKAIKSKGLSVPKEIRLSNLIPVAKSPTENLMRAANINDVLLLNNNAPWRSVKEMTLNAADRGLLSTDSPAHVIYSNIGSLMHNGSRALSEDELKLVSSRVSKASGFDPTGKVFVGEYFALVMDNRILVDDDVQKIYKELGGVLPASPFAKR